MYNNARYSPPVNNLLQPDIYNRLDAGAIEKTRVVNTQLDQRLRVQQRLITKYRLAAERFHRREKDRVKSELSRINLRLPAIRRIPDFRNKFLYGAPRPLRGGLQDLDDDVTQSLPEVRTRKIRGVPEERPSLPFCERFFIHHLPSKKKFYKGPTPPPPPVYVESGTEEGGGDGGTGGAVGDAGAIGVEGASGLTASGETGDTLTAPSGEPATTLDDGVLNSHDVNVADSANGIPASRRLSQTDDATSVTNVTQQRNSATKLTESRQTSPSRMHDNKNIDSDDDDDAYVSRDEKGSAATVKTGHRGRPHSINGRQSPRKSLGYVPSDSVSLPPLQQQNKKLARSSPQLYHG